MFKIHSTNKYFPRTYQMPLKKINYKLIKRSYGGKFHREILFGLHRF